jgi:uncharacterized protein YfbU (UPF0304 family)
MKDLDLNDTERYLLANQLEILGILNNDDDFKLRARTLRAGYAYIYNGYPSDFEQVMPAQDVKHVVSILSIYGDMATSFRILDDKSGITQAELNFPGFDGNTEYDLLGFARSLQKNGYFDHVIGDGVENSHIPTTAPYRRMIQEWAEMGEPKCPMSKEQIQGILAA